MTIQEKKETYIRWINRILTEISDVSKYTSKVHKERLAEINKGLKELIKEVEKIDESTLSETYNSISDKGKDYIAEVSIMLQGIYIPKFFVDEMTPMKELKKEVKSLKEEVKSKDMEHAWTLIQIVFVFTICVLAPSYVFFLAMAVLNLIEYYRNKESNHRWKLIHIAFAIVCIILSMMSWYYKTKTSEIERLTKESKLSSIERRLDAMEPIIIKNRARSRCNKHKLRVEVRGLEKKIAKRKKI